MPSAVQPWSPRLPLRLLLALVGVLCASSCRVSDSHVAGPVLGRDFPRLIKSHLRGEVAYYTAGTKSADFLEAVQRDTRYRMLRVTFVESQEDLVLLVPLRDSDSALVGADSALAGKIRAVLEQLAPWDWPPYPYHAESDEMFFDGRCFGKEWETRGVFPASRIASAVSQIRGEIFRASAERGARVGPGLVR